MDGRASAVAARLPTRLVVWLLILGGLGGVGVIAVHQFHALWAPRGWWDLALTRPAAYLTSGTRAVVLALFVAFCATPFVGMVVLAVRGVIVAVRAPIEALRFVRAHGLGRAAAHAAPWVVAVAVPVGVMTSTGGVRTIPFWLIVVLSAGLAAFLSVYVGPFLLLPLQFVVWVVGRLVSLIGVADLEGFQERVGQVTMATGMFGLWVAGCLWWGSRWIPEEADLRAVQLPTADPVLGTLLTFLAAGVVVAAASVGVLALRRRYIPVPAEPEPPPLARTPRPIPRLTPLPPEPGLEEEFWSPEVVKAWRVWTWDGETLHGRWTAWPSETLTARCDHCEEVPGWQHTCGIYATKDRLDLWVFGHWRAAVLVVGQVELSGLVIEHDLGYRAEHARITHLWVDGDAELAEALRDRYPGVVVTVVWLPGH